jgi:AraC-like DNA-binding protein/quercetin dioxygenase-like cupin family protein
VRPVLSPPGEPFDVRSLAVTYPDGAGEVRHRHSWGQLVYGISGVIRVETDAGAWLAPPTRAIWLPPGVFHALFMKGQVAMRTLYITPERAAPLPADAAVLEVAPLLRELIAHVTGIGMLDPTLPEHDRMAGLLVDLLVEARAPDLFLPMPADRRAAAFARRLQDDPGVRTPLADLARQAGASLRTLQRLFPRETGLSLDAWRQKARLIQAVASLSRGDPVAVVAHACGYDSQSAFIAAFKRQFGVTPGRYAPMRSSTKATRSSTDARGSTTGV